MFSIGGVALNVSMQWQDRHVSQDVEQTVRRTLTGNMVVFSAGLVKGQKVTLVSTEESGWLTKATVDSLLALASVPGAVYSMIHAGVSYSVIFRHDESPAVDFQPLIPRMSMGDGDYMIGTIKLRVI